MSKKWMIPASCLVLAGFALAIQAQPLIIKNASPAKGCAQSKKKSPMVTQDFGPDSEDAEERRKPVVTEIRSTGPLPPQPAPSSNSEEEALDSLLQPPPSDSKANPLDTAEPPLPDLPETAPLPSVPLHQDADVKPADFERVDESSVAPSPTPALAPKIESTANWVIKVEVVKTNTVLTASSKNAEFRVLCQKLQVQSPTGDIQAEGDIQISALGLEINCEKLILSWEDDWVAMEGKVRLQTQKNGQQMELAGEKLKLKLTTLTSTGALDEMAPQLYKSAYYTPEAPALSGQSSRIQPPFPTDSSVPSGNLSPYYYKRVTQD